MPYKDPEKQREYERRWREANRDKQSGYERRSRANAPEEVKQRQLEYKRRYREANRDRINEANRIRARRWRAANPEKSREQARRYSAKRRAQGKKDARSPAQAFDYMLKRKYGLSADQWGRLLAEQGGLCYLCSEPVDLENKRNIHVDHDHSCCPGDTSCGRCVRGLACACCNVGVAMFGDDPDRMERAAARLRVANAKVATCLTATLVQAELFDIDESGPLAG